MANFDVLSGRLLLDTSDFLRGLQQASAAAQLFSQRLGVSLQQARRDVEQLNASQLKLAVAARSAPRPGGASPWAAMFAGPAAAFNSPTGTTSQAALMGFVQRVNNGLAKQAELADQLGEAVERARSAVEGSSGGEEVKDKLKEGAKKVSEAIEKALDKVDEAVDKLKDAVGELADKSEEAADKVDELGEKVKDLGEKSEEADEKVDKLGEKAEDLGEKAEKAGEKLEKLGEKLKEILGLKAGAAGGGQGGAGNANVSTTTPGMSPQQKARAKQAQKIVDKKQAHEQDLKNQGINLGHSLEQQAEQFETLSPQQQRARLASDVKQYRQHAQQQIQHVRATARQFKPRSPEEHAQLQQVTDQIVQKDRRSEELMQRAQDASSRAEAAKLRHEADKLKRAADRAANELDKAAKSGKNTAQACQSVTKEMTDFDQVLKQTEGDTKELGKSEKEAAEQGKGQLAPQQQQMQQFQQQVQNWWNQQMQQGVQQMQQLGQQAMQQAGQQAWDSGQAMLEQAVGGPAQVQSMIDQAAATGHMKDAVALIRQRLEAQLSQSKLNLHALSTNLDPNAASFGAMPGVDNTAYLMTLDIPLVRLIKFLQAQLAALPKLAAGGIVTGATSIVAGEAGPEAVLPLTNFWNMMGSLPVFQGIQNAMESLGDWFSQGGTVGFGNMPGGNNPALAAQYFANLAQLQHVYEYSLDSLRDARSVNFTPASRLGGPPAGGGAAGAIGLQGRAAYGPGGLPFGAGGYAGPMFPVGSMNLHFNGVDITAPGAAVQFAQQLLPALDAEARRAGYSMMGGSMLRAGYGSSANRAFGYAR